MQRKNYTDFQGAVARVCGGGGSSYLYVWNFMWNFGGVAGCARGREGALGRLQAGGRIYRRLLT